MSIKPSDQLELELQEGGAKKKVPEVSLPSPLGAVVNFPTERRKRSTAEDKRLLDAITMRAAHLVHVLKKTF
jgi:hypothetical protein